MTTFAKVLLPQSEPNLGLIWYTLHGKVFPLWLEKIQRQYIMRGTLWDKFVPSMKWMWTKTRDFSKGYIFELMLMEPDLGFIWNTLHGKVFPIWLEKIQSPKCTLSKSLWFLIWFILKLLESCPTMSHERCTAFDFFLIKWQKVSHWGYFRISPYQVWAASVQRCSI